MKHFVIWLALLWSMPLLSAGISLSREIRIVLLGKTGAGKSSTGNTILGRPAFNKSSGFQSVTSTSHKESGEVNGRRVTVVDTPGLFDTRMTGANLKIEIEKCVNMSLPGPHVFLLVIRMDVRFTEEERNTVKWIQENFSERAANYTMVLFTHIEQLDQSVEHTIDQDQDIKEIINTCGGGYHALNYLKNQTSVKELWDKIYKMMEKNNGEYYTNEMYQEAQARMREEEERKREEEKKKKEDEERRIREDERQIIKKKEEEVKLKKNVGKIAGGIIGVAMSLIGGPVAPLAVGAILGGTAGHFLAEDLFDWASNLTSTLFF
ncbi:GTPase IMAP family member 7-like [Alosa sapidissima]|uniref:GTPase IMAP family member 7-like n=1 Tax=Alosa sapidissima TaxID=34773 RepID=UPI001C09F3AC|nr:GTPase IMAP family member 7-like [Alosa sapidissima]